MGVPSSSAIYFTSYGVNSPVFINRSIFAYLQHQIANINTPASLAASWRGSERICQLKAVYFSGAVPLPHTTGNAGIISPPCCQLSDDEVGSAPSVSPQSGAFCFASTQRVAGPQLGAFPARNIQGAAVLLAGL